MKSEWCELMLCYTIVCDLRGGHTDISICDRHGGHTLSSASVIHMVATHCHHQWVSVHLRLCAGQCIYKGGHSLASAYLKEDTDCADGAWLRARSDTELQWVSAMRVCIHRQTLWADIGWSWVLLLNECYERMSLGRLIPNVADRW